MIRNRLVAGHFKWPLFVSVSLHWYLSPAPFWTWTYMFPNRVIQPSAYGGNIFCCLWIIVTKTCTCMFLYAFYIAHHCKLTMFINLLDTFTLEKQNIYNCIQKLQISLGYEPGENSSSNIYHRVSSSSALVFSFIEHLSQCLFLLSACV